MDRTFASVLTGTDCWGRNPIKDAVAKRATDLLPSFKKRSGPHDYGNGYCYDGSRCKPENLGWRFQQHFGSPEPQEILDGKWDTHIEATYHLAASAEYWYRFEKDWGDF